MSEYPKNWPEISECIKRKNNNRCERCDHQHEVKTGYVLTVHHLDGDKSNCEDWNLAALCQRCHLHIQAKVKMDQLLFDFYEIASWFKPHLKGFLNSPTKIRGEK
ncbi:MAG: hypothetical protein KAX15_01190 [Candidatus Omnitrophica bacterium]|nr:hypothetical protein [Candidatus Omnitrophota bacterium]